MRKRICSILIAMCFVMMPMVVEAKEGKAILSNVKGSQTEVVKMEISLSDAPKANTVGLVFTYDRNVLSMQKEECQWSENGQLSNFDNSKDAAVWTSAFNTNLNGTLATVAFQIKNDAPAGKTPVSVKVILKDNNVELATYETSASVEVGCTHKSVSYIDKQPNYHRISCDFCGYEENENHEWDDGTVIREATDTTAGEMELVCLKCGYAKSLEIPVIKMEVNEEQASNGHYKPYAYRDGAGNDYVGFITQEGEILTADGSVIGYEEDFDFMEAEEHHHKDIIEDSSMEQNTEQENSAKKILMVAGVCIFILVIVLGAYYFVRKNDKYLKKFMQRQRRRNRYRKKR